VIIMSKKKKHSKDQCEDKSFSLPEDVKRAIIVVLFFALAMIFGLSLIGKGGTVGGYLNQATRVVFGWGAWAFPLMLILISLFIVRSKDRKYQIIKISAIFVFILVYSALLNLRLPLGKITEYLNRGQGGGYLGLALSYPLIKLTGFWSALIILTALGLVSLLVILENKLFKLGRALRWLLVKLSFVSVFSDLKDTVAKKFKGNPQYIGDINGSTVDGGNALVVKEKLPLKAEAVDGQTKSFHKIHVGAEEGDEDRDELTTSLRSKYRRKIDIPLNLLTQRGGVPSSGDINASKEKIKKTLENFGIEVEMGATSTGPTVTQYTLRPQEGVKLAQITGLSNDLALALAAHPIRIEAPIPGKSLVGVEVPNAVIALVGLREIMQSEKFRTARHTNLTVAIGKDVAGDPYIADLGKMPHLLIAGATGSGKSVCINAVILSLVYQNSPDDLKFILIDPKRVELSIYNGIPHLLTPVITDAKKTINALRWAVEEMDRRYDILAEAGQRDIEHFNARSESHLPYIVIMIDELADLMSVAAKEVEALIVRLAQMARAVGIHLVLATQRPSVNVITGLIKANITARVAFAVASQIDSRTILDTSGADKLLGRGDMLFTTAELSKPKRLQGAYVDDKEIKRVVKFLKSAAEPDYLDAVTEKKDAFSMRGLIGGPAEGESGGDELFEEARDLIIRTGKASASYLQRHLRVGYSRAARLLDLLEAAGVVGPGEGAKPRQVMMAKSEASGKTFAPHHDYQEDKFVYDEEEGEDDEVDRL